MTTIHTRQLQQYTKDNYNCKTTTTTRQLEEYVVLNTKTGNGKVGLIEN